MEPARVRLRVLGGNPLHGSDTFGFTDGDRPWNLSLGQRTGDGKFDGESFLVRLWIFSWGDGGREEETGLQGKVLLSRFRRTTRVQTIVKVPPFLEALDRHVCCSSFDNLTTSSTH
jgi:hypothetical protein